MLHQPVLADIRAALCDRIDESAVLAQRTARCDVSMPSALLAAGLYLADQGWTDAPSAGETFFAWGPLAYRNYLDKLTPEARAIEIDAGRRAIFEGCGIRPPLIKHSPNAVSACIRAPIDGKGTVAAS